MLQLQRVRLFSAQRCPFIKEMLWKKGLSPWFSSFFLPRPLPPKQNSVNGTFRRLVHTAQFLLMYFNVRMLYIEMFPFPFSLHKFFSFSCFSYIAFYYKFYFTTFINTHSDSPSRRAAYTCHLLNCATKLNKFSRKYVYWAMSVYSISIQ